MLTMNVTMIGDSAHDAEDGEYESEAEDEGEDNEDEDADAGCRCRCRCRWMQKKTDADDEHNDDWRYSNTCCLHMACPDLHMACADLFGTSQHFLSLSGL